MSQDNPSSSSTTARASPPKSRSHKVTAIEMYKTLKSVPDYSLPEGLVHEIVAVVDAGHRATSKQDQADHAMHGKLAKAVFIANLRELVRRLEPQEVKGWLTDMADACSCTETTSALAALTGIDGLHVGEWYHGLGNHLDKSKDPVGVLWEVLLPILSLAREKTDIRYKRNVARQPIPRFPPPRRDYAALASIDPSLYSKDEIIELVIPDHVHSLPTNHPGLVQPRRLETYQPPTNATTWESDCLQVKLSYYLRSGRHRSVPPPSSSGVKKIVMQKTTFEAVAWEGDADIRLENTRLLVELYRGKICIETFTKIEIAVHTNLSFSSGLDANDFFRLSVIDGTKVTEVGEHCGGTQFEAIWKITRETTRDLKGHRAWSTGYFKPQMEFLKFECDDAQTPPLPPTPSSSSTNQIPPSAPTTKPSVGKRKRDNTITHNNHDNKENDGTQNKRARKGRKGGGDVPVNDVDPINHPLAGASTQDSTTPTYPTSSFQPDSTLLSRPYGALAVYHYHVAVHPSVATSLDMAAYGVPPFLMSPSEPFLQQMHGSSVQSPPMSLHSEPQISTQALNDAWEQPIDWANPDFELLQSAGF